MVTSPGSATSLVTCFPSLTHENGLLYLRECSCVIIICIYKIVHTPQKCTMSKPIGLIAHLVQALHLTNAETEAWRGEVNFLEISDS